MYLVRDYTILDLETTGLNPNSDFIIEVGCVKVRAGDEVDRLQLLIKPPKRIPWKITNITGISDFMVSTAPKFVDVAQVIWSFLENEVIVGHNVRFDLNFLRKNFSEILNVDFDNSYIDTLHIFKKAYPGLDSYSLDNISNELGIISEHHRAIADCCIVKKIIDYIEIKTSERTI